MMDKLLQIAEAHDVDVVEMKLTGRNKGLYADNVIALRKDLTIKEKNCVLAEELGHHFTTHGDILDQSISSNRHQEYKARAWGIEALANLDKLIEAYYSTYDKFELAEYLNITDEYLADCIEYYIKKYGNYYVYNDYVIQFNPLKITRDKEA